MGRFLVYRGSKNIRDVGRVLMYNGEPEMDVWDGDECNQYHGTDTTIFPPFNKKSEDIWAFEAQVCRSLVIKYEKRSSYQGIRSSHYVGDFGDIANDPKLKCFCRVPPDECPIKGTFDLYNCVGAPIIASLPHFLGGILYILKIAYEFLLKQNMPTFFQI